MEEKRNSIFFNFFLFDLLGSNFIALTYDYEGGNFLDKDRSLKALLSIKEIFASLVNTFVCDGTPKVKPEQIVFLTMQGKIHRNGMFRYFDRDTLALVVDEERRPWFLIGFENQTGIDPDMDIRNLTYDATTWHWMTTKIRQTRKKIRCAKKADGKSIWIRMTCRIVSPV